MTVEQILESVEQLSDSEKLTVIEAIARMMRETMDDNGIQSIEMVAEVVAPYRANRLALIDADVEINFDDLSDSGLDALLHAHLDSPDPEPDQMLPRGLFAGMNFTEEDFRAAEWHPSAEDLARA